MGQGMLLVSSDELSRRWVTSSDLIYFSFRFNENNYIVNKKESDIYAFTQMALILLRAFRSHF